MKKVIIFGGGGFIGGHLSKRLKDEGCFVRSVDIKKHDYFNQNELCHEFFLGDLRDIKFMERALTPPNYLEPFDEVYQLAADMGGAGYINTGNNDAEVVYNSLMINLNTLKVSTKFKIKKLFFASSACVYNEHNQSNPDKPICEESSAYPANPDSEYGWEKLFSERLYTTYKRNHGIDVRIGRFHNIFGPYGTYDGGKEKAPAAICRKVVTSNNGIVEVWGDGNQTRSFLYIDECLDGILKLMNSSFDKPINIGSEEMISINDLTKLVIELSGKKIKIKNVPGPQGVRGRNSDNTLIHNVLGWKPSKSLKHGLKLTYEWINDNINEKI